MFGVVSRSSKVLIDYVKYYCKEPPRAVGIATKAITAVNNTLPKAKRFSLFTSIRHRRNGQEVTSIWSRSEFTASSTIAETSKLLLFIRKK